MYEQDDHGKEIILDRTTSWPLKSMCDQSEHDMLGEVAVHKVIFPSERGQHSRGVCDEVARLYYG